MPRKKQSKINAAAHARRARLERDNNVVTPLQTQTTEKSNDEPTETCNWDGTVNHELSSDSEFCYTDSDLAECSDEDDQVSEMEGDDLHRAANRELEVQIVELKKMGVFERLMKTAKEFTTKLWKKAEDRQRSGVNTGSSKRTKQ
ncbi:hypothetical protein H1R20_g4555, partial [Candolleomyces eurysporus]